MNNYFNTVNFVILFIILLFNFSISNNQRPSISGSDTLINDINKPFTQKEVDELINLSAYDYYDGDLTNKINLIVDNWSDNKNVVGNFQQHYSVTNSNNFETTYILNIYNIDFAIKNEIDINILSLDNKQTTIYEIIKEIEQKIQDPILNYSIVEDSYSSNYNDLGNYLIILSVNTKSKQTILINCYINVTKFEQSTFQKSKDLILLVVFVGVIITPTIFLIRKRRKK